MKKSHRPGVEQVPGNREALLGHLVDLREDPVAVVAAEVAHIDAVGADERLDLAAQLSGIGVGVPARVGGQEARHELAVDRHRRRGLRHTHDDHVLARPREVIPDTIDPTALESATDIER